MHGPPELYQDLKEFWFNNITDTEETIDEIEAIVVKK
jgi:hypothetical protein